LKEHTEQRVNYFQGMGERIREARTQRGLTLEQLAQRVGCSEELVTSLESWQFDKALSIFSVLTRMADFFKVPPESLVFQHTSLWDIQLNALRVRAITLMAEHKLTQSLSEAIEVCEQIDHDFDQAMTGHGSALHYRDQDAACGVDEDRIRDILKRVRNKSLGLGE
jgi:transcriptional regulator with XRE-family HTH domain